MISCRIVFVISICVFLSESTPVTDHLHLRVKRNDGLKTVTIDDRKNCKPGDTPPVTRVNTTERLIALRALFDKNGIDGYIIPTEDAHQSEYPSDYDLRRQYISGFTGSAGTAVVLRDKAALWTDGRYFLQGEDELDCNWTFMKGGEPGVPTMTEWLISNLGPSSGKVGASPFFTGSSAWQNMESTLKEGSVNLTQITDDLIDQIWTTGRPAQPNSTINALPMEYAGRSWQDKIADMRSEMTDKKVDVLIITGLDETAWLFNLRASDIAFNPFFISYAIIKETTVRLFLNEKDRKLTETPSDNATTQVLYNHLNTGNTGLCSSMTGLCVEVVDYSTMLTEVKAINSDTNIANIWVSFHCNYAIYSALSNKKIIQSNTPAALQKTRKNSVEQQGMRNSHIRDAVALIKFMAKLEKEVKEGKRWTEVSAAAALRDQRLLQAKSRGLSFSSISSVGSNAAVIHYRATNNTDRNMTVDQMYLIDSGGQYLKTEHNRGLSFPSISGSGPNGAVIHYFPTPATDRELKVDEMYLLDSGGQYLDGTTDVTRTFHFGSPTAFQKECYTRVVMGQVDLARYIFYKGPYGPYGREIDAIARKALWEVGLDYRHGTGHGIGMYLSVHEGPGRISLSHASFETDEKLDKYMFFSDEPGYYEPNQFGIRLENIVMVTEAKTKYRFMNGTYLTFETITMVPYEPHLIDYSLLSPEQIEWINNYHNTVQTVIGPLLTGDALASKWLSDRTTPVQVPGPTGSGHQLMTSPILLLCISLTLIAFK